MGDLLRTGIGWLSTQLKASASETVTYVRGTSSVDVQATLGKKLLKLDDGAGGVRMEWTDLDFIIAAADLVLGGVPVIPQRGDLIHVAVPYSADEIYEVSPYGSDAPWRWSDPFRTLLRIHGKRIA